MIRVILDTNVLISYLIGKSLKGLDIALKQRGGTQKKVILTVRRAIVSELQLEELKSVTKREKFKRFFTPAKVRELLADIDKVSEVIPSKAMHRLAGMQKTIICLLCQKMVKQTIW